MDNHDNPITGPSDHSHSYQNALFTMLRDGHL